jgi:phosphatidylglycerol:prolipoprotein diacylglycerol transferase
MAYQLGIMLGGIYAFRLLRRADLWPSKRPPVTDDQFLELSFWTIVGIIVGGRIGYFLAYDMSSIWKNPLELFMPWHGGMSFHGGFTGVAIAALLYCRSRKFSVQQVMSTGDLLAQAAPIGLFFGRCANFINGELWGRLTNLPWGVVFCNKFILSHYGFCPAGIYPRHPSELYEAAGEGIALFLVLRVLSVHFKQARTPGMLMGIFILSYGIFRILIEFVRQPDAQMLPFFKNVITMGQTLSIVMVITGGVIIWFAQKALRPVPSIEAGQV